VEDVFPGYSWAKLRDWGASDPKLIGACAGIAAFKLGRALGFSNDEEEMRWAELFFKVEFFRRQHRKELLRGKGAAPKEAVRGAAAPRGAAHGGGGSGGAAKPPPRRQYEMQLPQGEQPVVGLP
jgi:hypothetical protein